MLDLCHNKKAHPSSDFLYLRQPVVQIHSEHENLLLETRNVLTFFCQSHQCIKLQLTIFRLHSRYEGHLPESISTIQPMSSFRVDNIKSFFANLFAWQMESRKVKCTI